MSDRFPLPGDNGVPYCLTVTELRFPSPGLKIYVQGLGLSLFGIVLAAWGVVIILVDPWDWVGVMSMLGGGVIAGAGILLLLFVWFLYISGTISAWRNWRQLRRPTVVVNAEGAHYQAPRRPVFIPWPDVEEVVVKRAIFPKQVVTKVYLRLTPQAALLRDGLIRVPSSRDLSIGTISDPDVSEERAVRFLEELAGPRLQLTETDRRPSTRS